ncbi:MAG: putative membrane protein [Rhodothermales bacterium]|jgi:putative membrane protein
MKFKTIASLTALVGVAATTVMAQVGEIPDRYGSYAHRHGMMWGDSQWGGFGMFLGPVFMILILVGIVAAIIYLLRQFGGPGLAGNGHAAHDRAIVLLKERYAKGEIDSKEFEERKKLLAD